MNQITAIHRLSAEKSSENNEEALYDLSYDDLDLLMQSSGIALPRFGMKDAEDLIAFKL